MLELCNYNLKHLETLCKMLTFLSQICDLGSARSLQHTTLQTTAVGTYAWMSPEVGDLNTD